MEHEDDGIPFDEQFLKSASGMDHQGELLRNELTIVPESILLSELSRIGWWTSCQELRTWT